MVNNFKIGDKFVLKNSRDTVPLRIEGIYYTPYFIKPLYELKPIYYCGDKCFIEEETLRLLYRKITINMKNNGNN